MHLERRESCAPLMDAQTLLCKEEFVEDMEQRLIAAMRGAPTKLRLVECVSDTEQRKIDMNAAMRDALTK